MSRRTLLWVAGALAAVAVTVFLFDRSRTVDVAVHGEVLDALGRLDEASTDRVREGLMARMKLVQHYDRLVASTQAVRDGVDRLERALARAEVDRRAFDPLLKDLEQAVAAKRKLTERLKREAAVLDNSLRYLPLAAEMLIAALPRQAPRPDAADTADAAAASQAADAINAVVQATLVFDLLGEERLLERQRQRVATLEALVTQLPKSLRADAELFVRHAKRVASHHAVLEPIIRRFVQHDVESATSAVRARYTTHFEDLIGRADTWRTVLYGWCGVLLLVIALVVSKLRNLFASLERKVAERTAALSNRNRAMALVLDNVDEALLTVDRDGVIADERSAAVDRWFDVQPGDTLADVIGRTSPTRGDWFALGWSQLTDGMLPLEVCVEQLPSTLGMGDRYYAFEYKPLLEGDDWERMLVVVRDVSEAVALSRAETRQAELLNVFRWLIRDRSGYVEFHEEASAIVSRLSEAAAERGQELRLLHTLKGNASVFGLDSLAQLAHALEDRVVEEERSLTSAERAQLVDAWTELDADISPLVEGLDQRGLHLSASDVETLLELLREDAPAELIEARVQAWTLEPTARSLGRLSEHASRLADQLGRQIVVATEDHGVRVRPADWGPVWQAMVHVLRNAIDHGIEPPDERAGAGKPPRGNLTLATRADADDILIEVRDDGRGIDWAAMEERARERGLPHATREQLVDALLAEGVTTRRHVSDVSGRGVGLAAVRQAAAALGGRVEVESEPGQGTTVRLVFRGARKQLEVRVA